MIRSMLLIIGVMLAIAALVSPALVAMPGLALIPVLGPLFAWLGAWAWLLFPIGVFMAGVGMVGNVYYAFLIALLAMILIFLVGVNLGVPV